MRCHGVGVHHGDCIVIYKAIEGIQRQLSSMVSMSRFGILTMVLFLVLPNPCASKAATFYVAHGKPNATDDGPGTTEQPWKTIGAAAAKAQPGDTVFIADGTYRERVLLKNSGTVQQPIRFEANRGAHVVVTGADRLTGWHRSDANKLIYEVPWSHRFITWSRRMSHPDDDYHRLIGRCEQVSIDNYLLRQVLEANQLAPGTFFVDITNQVLQAWDAGDRDLNKLFVEGSVRQDILQVQGAYVQVRGLQFRLAANMAQHGAVTLGGSHDVLEDCVIESMNASGASFTGEDDVVRRCVFRDNGQLGFGASGAHRLLFTDCLVENNNTKGFDRGWEAGGTKLVLSRDAVLERSRFVRNRGSGVWFDIGNEHCTVRQCLVADNEDAGIFCEISFGLHAHDNVIIGNGFAETPGAWGAQAGISLSSSPDCVIERNLILGNREGFNFREQLRTTPRIGKRQPEEPVWNHDERVAHNIIAFNRDAQIWGWFDVKDNRHWPGAELPSSAGAETPRTNLKDLRLSFIGNVYFGEPGQPWYQWGPSWARHKSYLNLREFQSNLGIDKDSAELDPGFADLPAGDLRLDPDAMARLQPDYPTGSVPGVILGVRAQSPQASRERTGN